MNVVQKVAHLQKLYFVHLPKSDFYKAEDDFIHSCYVAFEMQGLCNANLPNSAIHFRKLLTNDLFVQDLTSARTVFHPAK